VTFWYNLVMNTQNVVIYQEGKYFVAQSLGIDVSSFGSTYQEALENISEALTLKLEDVRDYIKITNPKIAQIKL
jgi:predicted RNase H-like HicB family nuclease